MDIPQHGVYHPSKKNKKIKQSALTRPKPHHQECLWVSDEHVVYIWFSCLPQEKDLEEHCMAVHLLETVSSPSVACYALRKTADDNCTDFPPEVIKTVRRNFYIDDLLKSLASIADAVSMVRRVISICHKGSFALTQWISNSWKVLQSLPQDLKSKHLQELDLDRDRMPLDRALD